MKQRRLKKEQEWEEYEKKRLEGIAKREAKKLWRSAFATVLNSGSNSPPKAKIMEPLPKSEDKTAPTPTIINKDSPQNEKKKDSPLYASKLLNIMDRYAYKKGPPVSLNHTKIETLAKSQNCNLHSQIHPNGKKTLIFSPTKKKKHKSKYSSSTLFKVFKNKKSVAILDKFVIEIQKSCLQ